MTKYKFTYFDITGMGEISRFLFAYGYIKYEDIRISGEEFFGGIKKDLPYGLLPILEIDGKVVAQSLAIARYLATQVGLYGKDAWENLLIDEAVGHIDDIRMKLAIAFWDTDQAVKERKMNQVKTEYLPYYLNKFETLIEKNGGHFVLDRFTLADIFFSTLSGFFNFTTATDVLKDYPNLRKLVASVEALPGIKDWIGKRPKGMF